MEDADYGKLIWTDSPPKNPAWKTALLLFVVIFLMNFAYGHEVLYLAFALISACLYLYFSFNPGGMSSRIKVYENGILASVRPGGSRVSFPNQNFFRWTRIKSLKIESKGIFSKTTTLLIETGGNWHSTSLEFREGFVSSCKNLKKEVLLLM